MNKLGFWLELMQLNREKDVFFHLRTCIGLHLCTSENVNDKSFEDLLVCSVELTYVLIVDGLKQDNLFKFLGV